MDDCGNAAFPQIRVVFECDDENPFLIVEKPHSLSSAMLRPDDEGNATFQAAALFPQLRALKCRSPFDFGLLNRLDFATRGILLFAATQDAYDFLLAEQAAMRLRKFYTAHCDRLATSLPGMPQQKFDFSRLPLEISTCFRPFGRGGKEVRPCFAENPRKNSTAKRYSTRILQVSRDDDAAFRFRCEIAAGFRHQIRCHLCMAGFPIQGDAIYNPESSAENLRLCADAVEFVHPVSRMPVRFSCDSATM